MKKLILILLFTPLILISQDGLVTTHNKSGEIVSEYNYKDDKLHGWFKRYDGSLIEEEGSYKYGERHGLNKTYYTYGDYAIMSETNFRNGYEEGERRTYFQNGQIESINNYEFGELSGKQTTYYENGNIWQIEYYRVVKTLVAVFSEEHGRWRMYYENGDIMMEQKWDRGNEIYSKEWDEEGNLID